jgi:uncharacterized protein YjbI with pentapeptide repeats
MNLGQERPAVEEPAAQVMKQPRVRTGSRGSRIRTIQLFHLLPRICRSAPINNEETGELQTMWWTKFARVLLLSCSLAFAAGAEDLSCPAANRASGGESRDFRNQTIENANFSYQDLTNANFSHATLRNPYFAYANLTNADFRGATIISDDSNPASSDFSFANLEKTCFIDTRFQGLTYFTNATLTCADFSKVDLSGQNVIFGDSQLTLDRGRQGCRLAFRFAKMDCEFLNEWRYLDLAGADVEACAGQFAGQDFSGAKLNNVNFAGANLNGTKFVRADLNQANLNRATLIEADLSYASLLGARLDFANLTNATLYHAFLSNDTGNGIANAASLQHAHLKNANLSYAQLSGVKLVYSNLYGANPAGTGQCKTAPSISECQDAPSSDYEGFACNCASAHGATMRQTNFSNAYLYGVDFTSTTIQATDFTNAILTGANLRGSVISNDPVGRISDFTRAFLQGTSLDGSTIRNGLDLFDAFVDFRDRGNSIFIMLDGREHNQFACNNCSPPTHSDVCVAVTYHGPTLVPESGVSMKSCPDGEAGDCGPANSNGLNRKWQSRITDLAKPRGGIPAAWYLNNSTYIAAPTHPNLVCEGKDETFDW